MCIVQCTLDRENSQKVFFLFTIANPNILFYPRFSFSALQVLNRNCMEARCTVISCICTISFIFNLHSQPMHSIYDFKFKEL